MWPKRKPRNRRIERGHVLDVKLSTEQRRRSRMRTLAVGLGGLFVVLFSLFLIYRGGEWTLQRLVFQNPSFAIHVIDVQTDGVISLDQVRRWAGVKLEDNLLALDMARIKRDLETVPLIESASVERELPHTLRIRVIEREPVAQFIYAQPRPGGQIEKTVYLLDVNGYVMPPLEPAQRSVPVSTNEVLPVISGIPASRLRLGRAVDSPQVLAALRLVLAFEQSSLAGLVEVKQIDVSAPEILQVSTDQQCDLVFSIYNLDQQLRRWRAAYDYGQKFNRHLASLDLSVANNVPARWLDAGVNVPVPPKILKPSRYRKKHV